MCRTMIHLVQCDGTGIITSPGDVSQMPTVAVEGQFRFVVNTRENSFEPPHVHIWVGNEDVCRIELNGGTCMDHPPPWKLPGHHAGVCETR